MTGDRVPIRRRLTEPERDLLAELLAAGIAEQMGITTQAAAAQLGGIADQGKITLRGDDLDVYLDIDGKTMLHCERDWLAFHAEHPEAVDLDKHRVYRRTSDLTDEADRRHGKSDTE